jgi:hypothetical protein
MAPNKLQCYITVGWKGLSGTNALAYWAYLYVMKKMKCCEYCPSLRGLSATYKVKKV